MSRRLRLVELAATRLQREIHHFLWTAPSLWGETVDAGWNCRDHAWVTALLARGFGYEAQLHHGAACYVTGATAKSGTTTFVQNPHSWVVVENAGAIDFSIKPEFDIGDDRYRFPFSGIFANAPLPRGRGAAIFVSDTAGFSRAKRILETRRNHVSAAYRTQDAEYLHQELLTHAAGWIGSPLTHRLDEQFGNPSGVYCALALHLFAFAEGDAPCMSALQPGEAWNRIAGTCEGAIPLAIERFGLSEKLAA